MHRNVTRIVQKPETGRKSLCSTVNVAGSLVNYMKSLVTKILDIKFDTNRPHEKCKHRYLTSIVISK